MTPSDEEREPSPEQLAAFFDGEYDHLGGLSPDRIETWLTRHPDAAAQARAQRRLARIWQKTSPDEPAPEAWRRVLTGIERGLDDPAGPRPRPWRWWGAAVGLIVAAAACVALALVSARRPAENPRPDAVGPDLPIAVLVLPIADDDEVEILSVRGADLPSLVVGVLPVQGLLVLADPGEVSLIRSRPAEGRSLPEIRMNEEDTPMVWPSAPAETKQTPTAP